jgi:hypothetical protein
VESNFLVRVNRDAVPFKRCKSALADSAFARLPLRPKGAGVGVGAGLFDWASLLVDSDGNHSEFIVTSDCGLGEFEKNDANPRVERLSFDEAV